MHMHLCACLKMVKTFLEFQEINNYLRNYLRGVCKEGNEFFAIDMLIFFNSSRESV